MEARLGEHPVEIDGASSLLDRLFRPGTGRTLRSLAELRGLLDHMASDDRVDGLLLHITQLSCGFATCQSLHEALAAFGRRGKRVAVYLPLGGGNRELFVALAAERIYCPPQASLSLLGAGSQTLYVKSLLERIGVQADVLAVGEYKTAAEPLLRDTMSEAQREQVTALLEAVQRELERALAARPGFDAERARAAFARGIWSASLARSEGLIDGCCYEDELPRALAPADAEPVKYARAERYAAWRGARLWKRIRPLPEIAVVHVHGTITHAARSLTGSRAAALPAVVAALRRARTSRRVSGVILHVDSPGGSALASDLIHREVVRLREKKPVVAYMGDVAASGGYYVAAPCHRIVAQPTTVTGSIGVISVRLLGHGLAERVGVRPQGLRSAPHADIHSPFRILDDGERALLTAETEAIYDAFVNVVAEGRKRPREEIERVARGRVWSGADAARLGLVDDTGGMDRAIAVLRELAPALRVLPPDQLQLRVYRAPRMSAGSPELAGESVFWGSLVRQLPSEIGEALALARQGEGALYYSVVPALS